MVSRNDYTSVRLEELEKIARQRRLDVMVVCDAANIYAITGVMCDNAILTLETEFAGKGRRRYARIAFYTDFRYVPMVHRVAPGLKVRDIRKFAVRGARIGYEAAISHARFLKFAEQAPKAKFVDVGEDLAAIRSVKTADEIAKIRAAEALDCAIWETASRRFRPGMTEKDMARIIRKLMIDKGDGEAFDTIVCVGANAAECHHVPDGTVWDGKAPILVDMGVKLNGVCSDLTRNLVVRPTAKYRKVYDLVRKAHDAAIAAARPGLTAKALDKVARDVIRKGGYGPAFGHSLGHGVGYEIHEAPTVSRRSDAVLSPGMTVTIEPGVYLEGELGVRIEDLILITEDGCEVLSRGQNF